MQAQRRVTATPPDGTVVFVVGLRINRFLAVHRWLPVVVAMPRMLSELARNRELGLLGRPRTFVSGRLIQVQSYWASTQLLEAYAKAADREHLPAWRTFNRRARKSAAVGIYHETYVIGPGLGESIYVHVPKPILLADAVGDVAVVPSSDGFRARLDGDEVRGAGG